MNTTRNLLIHYSGMCISNNDEFDLVRVRFQFYTLEVTQFSASGSIPSFDNHMSDYLNDVMGDSHDFNLQQANDCHASLLYKTTKSQISL